MKRIQYLYIRFENRLSTEELMILAELISNKFRDKSMLFLPDPNRYPLIQYKLIGGRLCMVCLGEGTKDVIHLLQSKELNFFINNRDIVLSVEDIKLTYFILKDWKDTLFTYKIEKWMPYNNISDYNAITQVDGKEQRIDVLQRIMSSNLSEFYKYFGYDTAGNLEIEFTSPFKIWYSNNNQQNSYSFYFISSLTIPYHCGIGANSFWGNGIVHRIKITNLTSN